MTYDRTISASQHGRHPAAVAAKAQMTDCVDPAMNSMEPARS
jgi:hypothetical protein